MRPERIDECAIVAFFPLHSKQDICLTVHTDFLGVLLIVVIDMAAGHINHNNQ